MAPNGMRGLSGSRSLRQMGGDAPKSEPGPPSADAESVAVYSRGYLTLLLISALLGIPISVVAFGFLAAVHQLEQLVWDTLPEALGYAAPPAWWPVLAVGLAGLLVALAVTRLPGRGGHVPADGLGGGATPPSALPGVLLAAAASLGLGAVIGPEAPLMALGSGLALLAFSRTRASDGPSATAIVATSGSAAAISTVFGNPLAAAVMILEVAGLARRQTTLVVLPCLLSSGLGAIVFTGLGDWSGLQIGALTLPDLEPTGLAVADLAWAVPVAAVIAVATWVMFAVGGRVANAASARPLPVTVAVGLLTGVSAMVYVLVTDRPVTDVVLSGQETLATLAASSGLWSAAALAVLLACKGVAYALCLGAFRGGPVFPAIFLGAASGVLASWLLPGFGGVAGLAIGIAAGAAVIGLPVTSLVLAAMLLGDVARDLMPAMILATVTALVVEELLTHRLPGVRRSGEQPAAP